MNIVFAAIFILILLIPPFIFRATYLNVPYKKTKLDIAFLDKLFILVILSFFINIPFYLLIDNFICDVDETKLYLIFINSEKIINYNSISSCEVFLFFIYITFLSIVSLYLARILKRFVLNKRLYIRFSFLNIYSDWYIYFTGLILEYPNQPKNYEVDDILVVWIDVLVQSGSESYLYCGFLSEYVLGDNDSIDRLYLKGVRRRKLNGDIEPDKEDLFDEVTYEQKYYYMPGDYFLIPGDKIQNINLTYYSGELVDD